MKILISNYSFVAAASTITFNDYATITLDGVLLITNVTDGIIIYQFNNPALGGTVSTNVLTLDFSTVAMSNTDNLQIFYEDVDKDFINDPTDGTLVNLGTNNDVTIASLPLPVGASTEATLALIKAKTDNLDVLLSTRTKPADTQITSVSNFPAVQPVSGTFFQATQPVSIASTVTITGALTDTELRATPVPISLISTTITGTVACTQSGTWNINNISGVISLPTGASTEATLSTLNTKIPSGLTVTATRLLVDGSGVTQPISGTVSVGGTVPVTGSFLTDTQLRATPVPVSGTITANIGTSTLALEATQLTTNTQIGIVTETAPASDTASSGLNGRLQRLAQRITSLIALLPASLVGGRLDTNNGSWLGSTAPTVGQKTMANSIPFTLASDQASIPVTPAAIVDLQTYSASITGLVTVASATDIFTITGSGTKTIKVINIHVSATRTTDSKTDISIIKRSTANTGGTSTAPTIVPHDSNNAAGTATVLAYTANPTLGTTVGTIRVRKQYIPVASSSSLGDVVDYEFGREERQPITLRGTSQVLAINLLAQTITGPSFDISVTWTEE